MNATSANSTTANTNGKGFTAYSYSRETLLSHFDADIFPPTDLDKNLSIFSPIVLPPLANVALSEFELKILAQGAVNSDISRRTNSNYDNKQTYNNHRGDRPVVSSRGGARRTNSERTFGRRYDTENSSPERRANIERAAESNTTDEKSVEEKTAASLIFGEKPQRQLSNILSSSSSAFGSPVRQLSSNALVSDPTDISDIFGSMAMNGGDQSNQLSANSSVSRLDPFLKSNFANSSVLAPIGTSSATVTDSPQNNYSKSDVPNIISNWFYKDPMGNIQGPFNTDQMQDWFSKSFFSEDLPVKREQDMLFEPLSNLLIRFGRDRPFILSDEAERTNAINQLDQRNAIGSRLQSQSSGVFGGGYSPFSGAGLNQPTRFNSSPASAGLYGNDFIGGRDIRFGAMDHLVHTQGVQNQGWGRGNLDNNNGGYNGFRNPATSFGQNAPDLSFGIQQLQPQQQQYQSEYNPITSGTGIIPTVQNTFTQFTGAGVPQFGSRNSALDSFSVSSPAKQPSPVSWQQTETTHRHQELFAAPAKDAEHSNSANNNKTQSSENSPAETVFVAHSPTPEVPLARTPSPARSPQKTSQHIEPVAAAATELKSKSSKKAAKKAAAAAAAIAISSVPAASTSSANETPESPTAQNTLLQPQHQPLQQPTPAPWAGNNKPAPKLSLKEVQELEQREAERRERERAKKAHLKLMAEAQALAEMNATNATILAGGVAWTAGLGSKKSLADIMKEEETRRKAEDESTASNTGGKRYADSMAAAIAVGGVGGFSSGSSVVSGKPNPVPTVSTVTKSSAAASVGWSVVGAPAKRASSSSLVATAAAVVAPPAIRSVPARSSPTPRQPETSGFGGISPGFLQWSRQALSPLGRSTTAGVQ
ncbi:hypothetical protein HK100_009122, partial [Physocladia obscura]